jgi:hypothetical protein
MRSYAVPKHQHLSEIEEQLSISLAEVAELGRECAITLFAIAAQLGSERQNL